MNELVTQQQEQGLTISSETKELIQSRTRKGADSVKNEKLI